jgi:hypothetical protein
MITFLAKLQPVLNNITFKHICTTVSLTNTKLKGKDMRPLQDSVDVCLNQQHLLWMESAITLLSGICVF